MYLLSPPVFVFLYPLSFSFACFCFLLLSPLTTITAGTFLSCLVVCRMMILFIYLFFECHKEQQSSLRPFNVRHFSMFRKYSLLVFRIVSTINTNFHAKYNIISLHSFLTNRTICTNRYAIAGLQKSHQQFIIILFFSQRGERYSRVRLTC